MWTTFEWRLTRFVSVETVIGDGKAGSAQCRGIEKWR